MRNALLTMGGSVKEAGSTGGFGAAKKLLLFAHESFAIHSNDTYVEGKGLAYKFVEKSSRLGTKVEALFTPDFDQDDGMTWRAEHFLAKCDFRNRCKIYVNDVLFTNYNTPKLAKVVDGLGDVYANKGRSSNNQVSVRHKGLFMFDRYVSDLQRDVVVEVSGRSIDMFTQNRDGFTGVYTKLFDAFISELTIDKLSIVKPKARKFVVEGIDAFVSFIAKQFYVTPAIQAAINQIRLNAGSFTAQSLMEAVASKIQASASASSQDKATAESIVTFIRNGGANLQTDFHFDLADSSYRKVPEKFLPNVGKPKYTALAQLWKICIKEVLKANEISQDFVVGFTFSSSAVATHQKKNGVSCYLINPTSEEIDSGTKQEKVISILTIAAHEIVHSQNKVYHDEEFTRTLQTIIVKTLVNAPTWRQLLKLSKQEKV
jgi:hypothetical protein